MSRPKYAFGTTVYPKISATTDHVMMVTGRIERPGGYFSYFVTDVEGDEKEWQECALTDERGYGVGESIGDE